MNSPNINEVILKPVILWRLAFSKLSVTTSSNSQAVFKSQPQRKPRPPHLTSSTPFPRLLATADPALSVQIYITWIFHTY